MAYQKLSTVYKIVSYAEAKRRGDITRIANETGFTPAMVCMTLQGKRNNETIVNKAYRLVKDRKTNLQRLTSLV